LNWGRTGPRKCAWAARWIRKSISPACSCEFMKRTACIRTLVMLGARRMEASSSVRGRTHRACVLPDLRGSNIPANRCFALSKNRNHEGMNQLLNQAVRRVLDRSGIYQRAKASRIYFSIGGFSIEESSTIGIRKSLSIGACSAASRPET